MCNIVLNQNINYMKKQMTVGPLKKVANVETREVSSLINSRISTLTPNTIFEISGVEKGNTINNLRQTVLYYARKNNMKVYTKWSNNTMVVGLASKLTPSPVSKSVARKPKTTASTVKFVPNKPTNSPVAKVKSKPVAKPVV